MSEVICILEWLRMHDKQAASRSQLMCRVYEYINRPVSVQSEPFNEATKPITEPDVDVITRNVGESY